MARRTMNAEITVGFENAAGRQLPVSGESLPTLFGKLGKYCADLKPVAFSGSYGDLSGAPDNAVSGSASGTDITLEDSGDAMLSGLTIRGRSESLSGHIKSVGDNGLTVKTCGRNMFNINGEVNMAWNPATQSFTKQTTILNTVSGNILTAHGYANDRNRGQIISVVPGKTYTVSCKAISFGTGEAARIKIESVTPHTIINTLTIRKLDTAAVLTFTVPDGVSEICCEFLTNSTTGRDAQFTDIQFEECDVVHDWEQYTETAVQITTGLPLRSYSESVYDELDLAVGTVTTRCGYDSANDEVTVLPAPVVTALSAAELYAWRHLRSFDPVTHITAADTPEMNVSYLKNTANGRSVAAVWDDVQRQIDALSV